MEIDRGDSSETKLAKSNIEAVQEIIIFDRRYPSIELFN